MDKKKLNMVSGGVIAVGVVGFILTGGTEADASVISSAAVILIGAVTALWNAIKK